MNFDKKLKTIVHQQEAGGGHFYSYRELDLATPRWADPVRLSAAPGAVYGRSQAVRVRPWSTPYSPAPGGTHSGQTAGVVLRRTRRHSE